MTNALLKSRLENLKDLVATVKSSNADLGLAFDGDGDRVGLICEFKRLRFL